MNYNPGDARVRVLYNKRRVTDKEPPDVAPQSDGSKYLYEILPYYQVCFDVDQAGESQWFFEFWSTEDTTISGDTTNGRDLARSNYPIIDFAVGGQPNSDLFQAF